MGWRNGQTAESLALATLIGAGALAAICVVCIDMKLRLPGHAILRGVFPMAAGLALAPRRQGGTLMGISAIATAWCLSAFGDWQLGTGATTSLALIGPCLDLCLRPVRSGWKLYGAFAAAGLLCNLAAYVVRATTKLGGFDALTARPFTSWWSQAMVSYAVCGLVAGLVSAVIWFRFRNPTEQPDKSEQVPVA